MADCEKFIELTSEEIETIISEPTKQTNTRTAKGCRVPVFTG